MGSDCISSWSLLIFLLRGLIFVKMEQGKNMKIQKLNEHPMKLNVCTCLRTASWSTTISIIQLSFAQIAYRTVRHGAFSGHGNQSNSEVWTKMIMYVRGLPKNYFCNFCQNVWKEISINAILSQVNSKQSSYPIGSEHSIIRFPGILYDIW